MAFKKLLIAFVGIAGVVAQNNAACSSSNGLQIQNQGDADGLGSCTSFTGSITVAPQTSGKINIPTVRRITGDFVVDGATNVTSVTANSLQSIGGKFTLNNIQLLTEVSFPELTSVGDLNFLGLPNLATLGFAKNIQQVKSLNIQNTFLSSLTGINLQNVNSITITNNRMLQSLSFQVTKVAGTIILEGNGDRFNAEFPNLETAQNFTIRTCAGISIPSLKNVTGTLGFYENSVETISAVNLTAVGQTLAVNANPKLTNVSMPILKTIGGGFQVQNNTALKEVEFPAVQTIGGAFDFYGSLDKVSLPGLKDCRGGFNLQSSGEVDCAPFKAQASSNGVIKGVFKCYNKVSNPGNAKNDPNSGTSKKGSASFLNTPSNSILGGVACLIALIMTML